MKVEKMKERRYRKQEESGKGGKWRREEKELRRKMVKRLEENR